MTDFYGSKRMVCEFIVADLPTINNNVYPKKVLEEFVRECNAGRIFVTTDFEGSSVNLSKVIGTATDFELSGDGKLAATVNVLLSRPEIAALIDGCDFSPMVIVDNDGMETNADGGKTITKAKVSYFALTPKEK